MPTRPSTSQL